MSDLDLAVGILVYRECIDHRDSVSLAQPLELFDDLTVKFG